MRHLGKTGEGRVEVKQGMVRQPRGWQQWKATTTPGSGGPYTGA